MKNEALDREQSGIMNRVVLFTNFTSSPFTGMWDKQEFHFKPGESKYMEFWRARHFAKHLVNQELNDPKYPNGANSQSPKEIDGKWADPLFAELFAKAVKEQDAPGEEEAPSDEVEMIDSQTRHDQEEVKVEKVKSKSKPKPKAQVKEEKAEEEEGFGSLSE